ncbi:MAG: type II toxin-antitoxin system RelE/ParE family toxin [Mucilaginibacter sp.]|uniref:type II toxin-antitoxin system RelE family toxin n=1 Tax=Mucilaginibacter sp. TaxID=1882438 RepID=UPI0034E412C8
MQYIVEKVFAKAANSLPKDVQINISDFIKAIETAHHLTAINNIKKLKTNRKDQRECYRYKTGNYRVGFVLEEGDIVRLVVAEHRKNIYKNFP